MKAKIHDKTWGIVYSATLVNVSEKEMLRGTPYFGQSVRFNCHPGKLSRQRWREEVNYALSHEKSVGFMAAIREFGQDAFEWKIESTLYDVRPAVQEWADKFETQLIKENGGTLIDMHPEVPIRQTFNLQPGGKQNSFHSKDAFVSMGFAKYKTHLLEYVEQNGTSYVPLTYSTPCGYNLGITSRSVRLQGAFLLGRPQEEERREFLESLPNWSWDGGLAWSDHVWQPFKNALDAFVLQYGHSLVWPSYVTPNGFLLGNKMRDLRHRSAYLNDQQTKDERIRYLESLPFWSWNPGSVEEIGRKHSLIQQQLNSMPVSKSTSSSAAAASWNNATEERKEERGQKRRNSMKAKRDAKQLLLSKNELQKAIRKTEVSVNFSNKRKRDMAALRATIAPEATWKELAKYRKDGSVAKALKLIQG